MSRNLARTNCRTCDSKVVICGVPYQRTSHYQEGLWLADAICTVCTTKYSAWIGPTIDGYGSRDMDKREIANHGFYDLSYRSTFDDEPGKDDLPTEKIETFRVVKVGPHQFWFES